MRPKMLRDCFLGQSCCTIPDVDFILDRNVLELAETAPLKTLWTTSRLRTARMSCRMALLARGINDGKSVHQICGEMQTLTAETSAQILPDRHRGIILNGNVDQVIGYLRFDWPSSTSGVNVTDCVHAAAHGFSSSCLENITGSLNAYLQKKAI